MNWTLVQFKLKVEGRPPGDDPDDLSFAEAVAVVGPILAFSEDTDLTGRGLATNQWRDVPELHWRMRGADYTIGVPPATVVALLAKAIKAARRYPEIALIVVLVLALLFGPTGPERLQLTSDRAKAIGCAIAKAFVQVLVVRAEASAQLTARLTLGSSDDEALSDVVAELLQEREPVVFERLAARFSSRVSEDDLAGILGDWPTFVEVSPGQWQRGRSISPPSRGPEPAIAG